MKKKKEPIDRISYLLNELREEVRNIVPTKDEEIPEEEDLSKGELDSIYDIEIYFARRPGMRRSVHLITSNQENPMFRLSALTALSSICDVLVSSGKLEESDIVMFMDSWLEMHNNGKEEK